MKECLRCGGSAYRDFAYGCDHQFWDDVIPEPEITATWLEETFVPDNGKSWTAQERVFAAFGEVTGRGMYVEHPTREGARQLWREQYAIGLMVDALFRRLTGWAKDGAELRAKREAHTFDPRRLDVRMGSFSYPDLEDFTGGEHLHPWKRKGEAGEQPYADFVDAIASAEAEAQDRMLYALWRAEQGLDVVHDHAMSGTPQVPVGWPDNRTPEEKAAPPLLHVLSGRRWKIGSDVWVFGEITEDGDIWATVGDGHRYRCSARYVIELLRVYGSAEVTSE